MLHSGCIGPGLLEPDHPKSERNMLRGNEYSRPMTSKSWSSFASSILSGGLHLFSGPYGAASNTHKSRSRFPLV